MARASWHSVTHISVHQTFNLWKGQRKDDMVSMKFCNSKCFCHQILLTRSFVRFSNVVAVNCVLLTCLAVLDISQALRFFWLVSSNTYSNPYLPL